LTAGGGTAQWFTGNLNHMAQNWFWYRSLGDTREYALSNQISAFIGANNVRLMYVEPIFDGQLPGALLFDLEYTLSDLSQIADPPACARCELVIALKVRNFTDEPLLPVDFFSYNDMDLNNSAGGDTAFIAGVDNQIQVIRERLGPSGCTVGGLFKCSSTSHVAWEIGPFAALRTRLTDPFVDVLLNGVSPFGPGDYTGGQQWSFALNPPGPVSPTSEPDEWVGSVVKEVVAYVPGDIDGDCDVDLDDLTLLLQNFGVICVP
jgi:hypothetical protein